MIELFKEPNIDWMGKAKYFYALSAILLIAGWTSIFLKGGPAGGGLPYSIDFKGGTNVDVRFAQPPNIEKIRSGLSAQGLGGSEIQTVSDIANSNSNEVLIFVGQKEQGEEAGEASKTRILTALNAIYGVQNSSKPDFNAATPATLATFLTQRDPLLLSTNAGDRYQQLAKKILDYRDTNSQGVLTNFDELSKVEGVTPAVLSTLKDNYALGSFAIRGVEIVGPKVGGELRRQAIYVTLYALAGMLVYIAFRFELVYGAAAVLAVFHDVLITLGFFSLLHFEISLTVIAALLTLVGYSMNDTIVIFDRIRENNRLLRRQPFTDIVNTVHQPDALPNNTNQWIDFPYRARAVPDGRPGATCFLLCSGGGDCGRNVLQFWHSGTAWSSPGIIGGAARVLWQAPDPQPETNPAEVKASRDVSLLPGGGRIHV